MAAVPTAAEAAPLPDDVRIIFVLGGPGSGKGTQCERLIERYGVKHLSAGDLLRAEVSSGSVVGEECQALMKEGKLVPTEGTLGLIRKAMAQAEQKTFIIDGFPRAVDQGEAFEAAIKPCEFVLFLDCPKETMQERLLKRGETSGRADDNLETIAKRFDTFMEVSMPVMDHFADKVHKVSSVPAPDEVFVEVCKVFEARGIEPVQAAAEEVVEQGEAGDAETTATAEGEEAQAAEEVLEEDEAPAAETAETAEEEEAPVAETVATAEEEEGPATEAAGTAEEEEAPAAEEVPLQTGPAPAPKNLDSAPAVETVAAEILDEAASPSPVAPVSEEPPRSKASTEIPVPAAAEAQKAEPARLSSPPSKPKDAEKVPEPPLTAAARERFSDYVSSHGVEKLLRDSMRKLNDARPEDPAKYLAEYFSAAAV